MEVRMGTADSPRCPVVKTSGDAATKLQKLYRRHRTRRKLADSAVIVEELWLARVYPKMTRLSGWLSSIGLRLLDVGEGKHVDLPECPRTLLKKQCIKYLGPQERKLYEYIINQGKVIHKQSMEPLDTRLGPKGAKWIFVMSTSKRLYAGKKEKGVFEHSSFLAGGATIAAGRLTAENGVIKSMWAYSGHYKPSVENISNFMTFLQENGVDLKEVEVGSFTKEYDDTQNLTCAINPPQVILPPNTVHSDKGEDAPSNQTKMTYKRTLSGGLRSPKAADVPQKTILERIKSKSGSKSYELGHNVSLKWSTGAGARIGCVNDYPVELRMQALEMVDLSPRASGPRSVSAARTISLPPSC